MQPDNETIISRLSDTKNNLRQLLINLAQAGATPQTMRGVLEAMMVLDNCYVESNPQPCNGGYAIESAGLRNRIGIGNSFPLPVEIVEQILMENLRKQSDSDQADNTATSPASSDCL